MNIPGMSGNMQNALMQLQKNPKEFIQKAGVNVPDEINSGQVGGPALQRIMPMIRQMGGKV